MHNCNNILDDEFGSLYLHFYLQLSSFSETYAAFWVFQFNGLQISDQQILYITYTGGNQLERKGLMQHSQIFGCLKFETMNYSFVAL